MSSKTTNTPTVLALEKENRKFRILQEIHKKIGAERDIDKLLPLIISEISKLFDADRTSVFLVDWDTLDLRAKFAEGVENDSISIKLGIGIVGWSVLTKQVVNITNANEHPYFSPAIDQVLNSKTESILVAPIVNKQGYVIGALQLLNKNTGCFTDTDIKLIKKQAESLGNRKNSLSCITFRQAEKLIEQLIHSTRCESGSIFRIDQESGHLYSLYTHGLEKPDIDLNLKLGIAGLVAVSGQVLNITDASRDSRFDSSIDKKTGYRTKTILALPLTDQNNENIGVIEVINKKKGVFNDADVEMLQGLSSIVGITVVNAMMFAEQEKQFNSFLEVMAASIDAKDTFTAGHSLNVTRYAMGIAGELGFNESEIDIIRTAGLLHDYGKLGIDDHILKKPGRLDDVEYEQIKQHVTITRNILEKMNFARKYRNVPAIAASHHEYIDGSGYDCGLKHNEIPFMAKIITVADVYEALTADRLYRPAMKTDEALAILHEGVENHKFDPNVVNALIRYLDNNKLGLPAASSAAS